MSAHARTPPAPDIGIFYGSTSWGTRDAAERIQREIGARAALHDVAKAVAEDLAAYEHLIFGTSTWGEGFLQHDWDRFIGELGKADVAGKKTAVFGLGDQVVWDRTFVDAMGIVYERLLAGKAVVVGAWPTVGYAFTASRAVRDGRFVGLALDKMNQRELHDERIRRWVAALLGDFGPPADPA